MVESAGTSTDVQIIVKILIHIFSLTIIPNFFTEVQNPQLKLYILAPLPFQGQNWVPDSTRVLSVQIMSTFNAGNHKVTPKYT